MNLRRWNWRLIGIVIGIALAVFLIGGIVNAMRNAQTLPPALQAMHLQNGELTNNRISLKSWSFRYKDAQISPDGNIATITGVTDGTYYRKGKAYLKLDAQSMTLNRASLDFTASGLVHVERIGVTDESFDTDLVVWTNSTKTLTLDHPSYLRTDGQALKVEHVKVDTVKNEVHIAKIDGAVGVRP